MKYPFLFFILVFVFAQAVQAERKDPETLVKAMEIDALNITLDSSLNGVIKGPLMTCTITPATQATKQNKPVPLLDALKRRGKFAIVLCDVKTKLVTEINW